MTEALETSAPAFIADALRVIARARGLNRVAQDAGLSDESLHQTLSPEGNSEMGGTLRVIHAPGLRLTAEPARR
jgi:probable addiction module antidote protein